MRTLTHRTGLGRGQAYAGDGSSLITYPEGAGNYQVGSWYLDYAALFPVLNDDTNFSQDSLGLTGGYYLTQYDPEFSWVIADGRDLKGATSIPDSSGYPDLDEDTPNEPLPTAVVQAGDRYKKIHRIEVDLWLVPPSFDDAHVWETDSSLSNIVDSDGHMPLVNFLDLVAGGYGILGDDTEDLTWNVWVDNWQYIKCPFHWALMKIPCTPSFEGAATADYENDNDSIIQSGGALPAYGPRGLLIAQAGFASVNSGDEQPVVKDLRLWEPCDGVQFINRGVFLTDMTLHVLDPDVEQALDTSSDISDGGGWKSGAGRPDSSIEFDYIGDPPVADVDSFAPSYPVHKNLKHVKLRFNADISVRPNELIVFMIQTGRVRLAVQAEDNNITRSYIMASPNGFSPLGRAGPAFVLVHHSVTVYHSP